MAGFAIFFTLAQLPCVVCAAVEAPAGPIQPLAGFLGSVVVGALAATLLGLAGRGDRGQVFRKEAIAVAGLSWLLAGLLGAIPFQWSGLLPDPIDAVFETVSGLTTTGATVLGSGDRPAVEATPASLLLWRSLLQWIGGIGIVLVFVALLPAMGVTGKNLLTSESIGVSTESYQPRALEKARLIGAIYAGMTAACAVALVTIGGFGWFDAACHACTAMATGGYSTRTSIARFDSLGGEIVLTVTMFFAGASLTLLATHWRSGWQSLRTVARSGEFRLYVLSTALVIGVCTVTLVNANVPFATALRQASFNGVSMLTSTGYATADFRTWPTPALLLLFGAMLVGGCSGSTAGGIKQVRVLVVLKLLGYSLRQFMRPKCVERIKLDNEVLPATVISSILAIVMLWTLTIGVGALLVSFDPRLDLVGALTASASMVGSTGPALTMVEPASVAATLGTTLGATTLGQLPDIGPFGGFGDLAGGTKLVLTAQMLLGRLELLTLFALCSPSFWRR